MNALANELWLRALDSLRAAEAVLTISPDTTASRAYYAAFYAVSAHFTLSDHEFSKHSAVEAAVHRDMVKAGIWPIELGKAFSQLSEARTIGDYGDMQHVGKPEAKDAIQNAHRILEGIAALHPKLFAFPETP